MIQIYGRDVPTSEDIWQLCNKFMASSALWKAESFKTTAFDCGLRKIARRADYFTFSGTAHLSGQASLADGDVGEIRLFIGTEPRGLTDALYRKDRGKHVHVAAGYSMILRRQLGQGRTVGYDEEFLSEGYRISIRLKACVWVVLSRTPTQGSSRPETTEVMGNG